MGHRAGADLDADRSYIERRGARLAGRERGINVSVLDVDPYRQAEIRQSLEQSGRFAFVEPDYIAHAMATPNDPDYPQQWHLPIIQAPSAWDIETGSLRVPIAMVDSGVDPTHPDLAANIVPGWSFLTQNTDTHDVLGHGTATAGTVAAIGDNGVGVSGVAWNLSIMPLVVLDSTNFATYSNIAAAIDYAADHGVRVVSISIGGTSPSSTLQQAVDYAWSKGTVVIAAAGNNGTSTPIYPAACQYVVAVGATDSNDAHTSWSSYGSWVDLAAPGLNIMTTQNGGGYAGVSGTSFSAPIVAGVAALMISENPSLTAQNIVDKLEQTADDLGDPGFDQYYGWGRVNAYKALTAAGLPTGDTTPPSVSISSPSSGATEEGQISILGTATDNVGVSKVELDVDGALVSTETSPAYSFTWNTANVANGSHTLTVKAYDAAGNMGQAAVSVNVNNPVLDTAAPSVTIAGPAAGASVTGTVAVQGTATDNVGVTNVQFYADGALMGSSANPSFSFSWDSSAVANGSHTLTVKAFDQAGNTGQASVTVSVNNPAASPAPLISDLTPPTVQILSPADGSDVHGTVKISAAATDNVGVTSMALYVNNIKFSSCNSSGCTWGFSSRKLSQGSSTVTVKAWDAAGNMGSASIILNK
ncbi:MAG TPA: S8 family serine peptidase [Bryobacteraceae bacterium]|nr:S8 family serine peptidase [Bryobacteraceae bacterium]